MASDPEQSKEFALPGSVNEGLFLSFFYGIILLGCTLSVWNLVHPSVAGTGGVVAAVLWLGIWLLFGGTFLYCAGPQKCLVRYLRTWSDDRFLKVRFSEDNLPTLWSGFRLFGMTFRFYEASLSGFQGLDWSMGQASSRCGKDMDDWMVFFILEGKSVLYQTDHQTTPETDYYCTGLGGSRERAEAEVADLTAFLKNQGLELVPGDKKNSLIPRP